ncbi:helix-turn-helix transcriptional regulator [Lactobacillus sp. ESL0225]|uniref:helix-turn-helix transcriptional regulator n=1 Tax=Lactobacillus sp. ESL0225 TaxID=2069351 RepID=UPI000EFA6A9F|nr:helix-turn-helix transcriptional regulator [Lactobacillus sp. ESL0225]RMC50859.1 XRE family transcriptional regulator [Lactobacillus sp. ESL0225]
MSLYTAVKTVANRNDKSIYQIEKDLRLSNGSISKWNKSVPRADSLQEVADYLGVTTQYLFSLARKDKVNE